MSSDAPNPLTQDTLRTGASGAGTSTGPGMACLSIACHPDPARIGERLLLTGLLAGQSQKLSRSDGQFASPGARDARPLTDPHVSRSAAILRPGRRPGEVDLDPGGAVSHVDGVPVTGERLPLSQSRLEHGVALRLGSRTLLLLHLRRELPSQPLPEILGDSDAIRALHAEVIRMARHDEPVLIQGETGTGKELVARALHAHGPRAAGPFVAVNMATLTDSMAASTLFGHLRGAFTGADRTHRGLFERADGGVLFLDEIGDTPASVQPMLLRVLETGTLAPLGAEKDRRVSVRVVTATDRDLQGASDAGEFRAPLLHRISAQLLHVPALRERRDDIPRLLWHFMSQALKEQGERPQTDGPDASEPPSLRAEWVESLLLSPWTGNVRELRNQARSAAMGLLDGVHPAPELRSPAPAAPLDATTLRPPAPDAPSPGSSGTPDDAALIAALEANDFVPERAARQLGLASSSMHHFMARSDLVRRAKDLPDAELRQVLQHTRGDVTEAARRLRVSCRALRMTLRQRGLEP